jgi:hypothetical protein
MLRGLRINLSLKISLIRDSFFQRQSASMPVSQGCPFYDIIVMKVMMFSSLPWNLNMRKLVQILELPNRAWLHYTMSQENNKKTLHLNIADCDKCESATMNEVQAKCWGSSETPNHKNDIREFVSWILGFNHKSFGIYSHFLISVCKYWNRYYFTNFTLHTVNPI